jgi:hypothetical protein
MILGLFLHGARHEIIHLSRSVTNLTSPPCPSWPLSLYVREKSSNDSRIRDALQVEDEFLKSAQNAARAKTLRAKFEQWETTDGKTSNHHVAEMDIAPTDGSQPSIESASSLRARFESLGSQPVESPRAAKVKVNRFVVSRIFPIHLNLSGAQLISARGKCLERN